jgi:hypothetical protein
MTGMELGTPWATAASSPPQLPDGDDDRVAGYGVIGLPFASGHYLAFRDFGASSFGPPYRSVWHRNPEREWAVYSTIDGEHSCPRYIGKALAQPTVIAPIDVTWRDDSSLRIVVGDALDWTMVISPSRATNLMTAMARRMPTAAWTHRGVMAVMGRMAGVMLGAGRMRLNGTMPNGQEFFAAPRRIWSVRSSTAVVHGADLGPIGPLQEQDHLGDFWLPQRGIFFADGYGRFGA